MALGRRARRSIDIWPGFVDALATLIMVIVFVLMVFVLAQYFLGQALSGRQKALDAMGRELASLAETLAMQKSATAALQAELVASKAERDRIETWAAGLGQDVATLMALKDELEAKIAQMDKALGEKDGALVSERKLSEEARAQAALLNRQMAALKQELARIAAALETSETRDREQKAQIADLGKRLIRLVINDMMEQKYGAIINIVSGSTLVDPVPRNFIVYSSLKVGLRAFSKGLFWELRDQGIKVTSILPGVTDTDLTGKLKDITSDTSRLMGTQAIEDAVRFALTVPANVCPLEISVINQQTPWTAPVIPFKQQHPGK